VATGLGAFLLLTPKAILIVIAVFLAIAAASRWIALASIFAAASLPLAVLLSGESWGASAGYLQTRQFFAMAAPPACVVAGAALIIAKHHANIRRLMTGTEPKFHFKHE
jgi:glycerol-3-phosphate acyltransferase PlsY